MTDEAARSTFNPTVLVVEDDKACRRYLRRQFHDQTSVGIALAGDLETGHRLAREIKFDALIFDLFFDQGTDWPTQEMYDGVDLAAAIQREQSDVPTYFLSFFSEDEALHAKAEEKNVTATAWLQKSFSRRGRVAPEDAPWLRVERDLLKERLEESPNDSDEDAAVSLALRLRRPIRTFIQELPNPDLKVTHPIQAICTLDEGLAKASAPALGLLEDGYGQSVQEALDDLAAVIQKQFEWLTDANTNAEDYAAAVRQHLMTKIVRGQR
jgi:CheY-like chemotaxis protein